MARYFLFFLLSVFFLSCGLTQQDADLILTNVTIIDISNDTTIPGQFIAISGDKIMDTGDMGDHNAYTSEVYIDLEDHFVMPGLWDNHVHFRGGEELIEANKELLPLFLSFGVTTVRDAGGDMTPAVQSWIKDIKAGELDGPHILTSGPKLDGENPSWDGSIEVTDSRSVQSALDSLGQINADYVKMYDGSLSADAFYEIIREAESRGLMTTGHMPLSADLLQAVEYGLDGTEHLYYILKAATPDKDSISAEHPGYRMITPLIDNFDQEYAREAYSELAEKNFFVTPTLHVGKTLAELLVEDHEADSLLNYIDPTIIETYEGRFNSARRGGDAYTQTRAKWGKQFRSMVKPMHDAGIHLLAGSDCGPFNSFVYPGESIHRELALMVESGLTPAEALATSVINGPRFFGLEDAYGSVSKNKYADLLILSQNPLQNIENTTSIQYMVVNGDWYSANTIQSLKDTIRK
jgi:imidazolonepropionase-like amidohydrolase